MKRQDQIVIALAAELKIRLQLASDYQIAEMARSLGHHIYLQERCEEWKAEDAMKEAAQNATRNN